MPQGEKYIEEAISLGIPTENLFTTYPVVNTYEEAKAVRTLLSKELTSKTKKIILVTSAFHMKRARKLFEREGIKVQPYPVDFNRKSFRTILNNPLNWVPSASKLHRSSLAIREIIGQIYYGIRN